MNEQSPTQKLEELMATLRVDFIDRAGDHLDDLDAAVAAAAEDPHGRFPDDMEFRRNVHSLKGSGGTFGFPLVTLIAHRLEDYLSDVVGMSGPVLADVQVFLDRLRDNIEGRIGSADEDAAEITRALPNANARVEMDVTKVDVEVMLVSPKDPASRIVSKELQECGFRVVNVPSPIEALQQIVLTKPDLTIASTVLDGLSGVDLACAIRAMPATGNMRLALLTSFEPGHAILKPLPDDIPIIHKGPRMADDLAAVLARLEMT